MADDPLVTQALLLAGLIRDNDSTARRMLESYAGVYRTLTDEWLALLDEVILARARGGDDQALSLLQFRAQRIEELRIQTARQIDRFAQEAERMVTTEQRAAFAAGQEHAAVVTAATAAVVLPGVRISFAQLPTRALETLVGRFANGMPLRSLFDDIGPAAAQGAQDALFRAVATGSHPRVAARQLRTQLGIPLTRALTISRTEMIGAYRTSTLMAYENNSDLVQGWRWNAHLDARTCPACLALHGSVHPMTERMHEHVNGRCVPSPVLVPLGSLGDIQGRLRRQLGLDNTGPQYFDGLSAAEQRAHLGPGKYALLQEGRITINDLVQTDYSPQWGLQYREASIAQALENHRTGGLRLVYDFSEVGL